MSAQQRQLWNVPKLSILTTGFIGTEVAAKADSIMQSRAANKPTDLHRVYILTQSDPDAGFDEYGECDTDGVFGLAEYYLNGVPDGIFPYFTPPGENGGNSMAVAACWWAGFGW